MTYQSVGNVHAGCRVCVRLGCRVTWCMHGCRAMDAAEHARRASDEGVSEPGAECIVHAQAPATGAAVHACRASSAAVRAARVTDEGAELFGYEVFLWACRRVRPGVTCALMTRGAGSSSDDGDGDGAGRRVPSGDGDR